jgi:hypothetical protein
MSQQTGKRMLAKGLMLVGAGIAGGGIYGFFLYGLTTKQTLAAVAIGLLSIGVAVLLGGRIEPEK